MPLSAFDTHKYAKQLKQAGVPDEQVEAQVSALSDAFQSGLQDLATKSDIALVKQDITLVKQELKQDINLVKQELKQEIALVKQELKQDIASVRQEIKQLDTRLTGELLLLKWMLGTTFAGVVTILVRLFFFRVV